MSIPLEFIPRATELGYFDDPGSREIMERAYDELEAQVTTFANLNGFVVDRDGFRIWGYKDGDTYLLAAAPDADDDPMNLWCQASGRIELIFEIDFPGQIRFPEKTP